MRRYVPSFVFAVGVLSPLFLFLGCGNVTGSGSGARNVGISFSVQSPDPTAGDSAKTLKVLSPNLSVGKSEVASLGVSTCTITGTGPSAFSTSFNFTAGSSSATTTVSVPTSSDWTFCVECADTTLTTNGILHGFSGCAPVSVDSDGASVSLAPKFMNTIMDQSDVCQSIRLNQESATQTKLYVLFGSVLTAAEKMRAKVLVEFSPAADRTALGVLNSSNDDGFVTGAKSGPYVIVSGGWSAPAGQLYDKNGNKTMRLNCSWDTAVTDKTQAVCTFGISQMKLLLDSDESGQFAVLCSTTGASPWDALPNSGYAEYNLAYNSSHENDVSSLSANAASCSAADNGSTCSSGFCGPDGQCGVNQNLKVAVGGGAHSMLVKDDGTLWTWGGNGNGGLGDGTTTTRSSAVQVVGSGGTGFLTRTLLEYLTSL